ncbi:hypothetical protein FHW58_005377 [Duganella sp. 1224]|uniref:hypothetical protein n=1 Tax=Duganella sp. 1224 TaxID=2587052 RepID=UPI0015C79894|nr:hypothetical protein [Duganella sp. 1224]NYE64142.1 hypothetical protein [Duganella sp. 1224]
MMDSPEKFATSLISLALVRKGYTTSKEIRYGNGLRADLFAVGKIGDVEENFVVEVRAIPDHRSTPPKPDALRARYKAAFGVTVYLAFFVDKEDLLIVDDQLQKRMRFSDEQIRLEPISLQAAPRLDLTTS